MKVARTTKANAIIIVWLTPIMILGKAIGIFILNKSWNLLDPKDSADSIVSFDTCLIPKLVNLIIGGIA